MYYASTKLNYCMPLQTRLPIDKIECYAREFCLNMKSETFTCTFCASIFHIVCVEPPMHRRDSCGCHRLPFMVDHSRYTLYAS